MQHALNLRNAFLLTLPPLLWAGNAVVGRIASGMVPPITLNAMRWGITLVLLLPLAAWVLRPGSGLWRNWRHYLLLSLLSVGLYNALQYLALRTSTPVNVTLVGSSTPVFMLLIGAFFFAHRPTPRQVAGAALSVVGVLIVLAHGELSRLTTIRFVPGDLYMLMATAAWAWYSWLLTRTATDDPRIRGDWAAFLLAQVAPGILWASAFAVGEWRWLSPEPVRWGWPLVGVLAYITLGASILAYRSYGLGIQRLGPNMAAVFGNLTPVFAALLSAAFLGDLPHLYHAVAFVLIIAGIWVSARP
jgi:drug/metabolite transporter (DMT)-like permease